MSKTRKTFTIGMAVALSTAAVASQAQTQVGTNVTLYGVLDANINRATAGEKKNGGASVTRMNDGHTYGLNGSRWGVKVNEDLGHGTRAAIVLEQGLGVDDGTLKQGSRAFGRQAYLGLAQAGLGEVRLGRQYAMHDEVLVPNNPFTGSTVMFPGGAGLTNTTSPLLPQFIDGPRIDNMVQYLSPSLGGLTGQVAVGLGEGSTDRYQGVKAAYAQGPLFTAMAYEWNTDRSTDRKTNKTLTATASYNFGAFKLMGGLQSARDLSGSTGNLTAITNWTITGPTTFVASKLEAWTAGVAVPLGALTLGGNYTHTTYSGAGSEVGLGRIAAAVKYDLSRQTAVYGGVAFATDSLKEYIGEKRMVQVGMRKAF